jgi:trehalose 6-phosphate phosphatase
LSTLAERAADLLSRGPAALLTDFDGTLSPIVDRPDEARMLPDAKEALERLNRRVELVGVVSGRPVGDLVAKVALPGALFVGNHGAERWRDGVALLPTATAEQSERLSAACDVIKSALRYVPGIMYEEKNLGFAVHYREASSPDDVRARVFGLAGKLARLGLAAREGKRVFEIRFLASPTKGTSVDWIVEQNDLRAVLFVGDDHTDVDAFNALRARRDRSPNGAFDALNVAVLGRETPRAVVEAADASVADPHGVAELLCRLADLLPARQQSQRQVVEQLSERDAVTADPNVPTRLTPDSADWRLRGIGDELRDESRRRHDDALVA